MKAKKFKKWLLSNGVDRDDAAFLLRTVKLHKGFISYDEVYAVYKNEKALCGGFTAGDIFQIIYNKGVFKKHG